MWYYLTDSWEDKEVHTFPKGICPKVNVIARLEFELAYYDSAVHRFNHYTRTPASKVTSRRWFTERYAEMPLKVTQVVLLNSSTQNSFFAVIIFLISFYLILFINPSARAGYDTRSIFKRSLTGLVSEFSFS